MGELRVWEIMKRPVRRLYGEGKVVLDPEHSCNFLPCKCHHGGGFLVGGQVLIGIDDDRAYFIWLRAGPVKRQVRANESPFSVDHVTVRAVRCPEEERFPLIGISGEFNDISSALQDP